jgi:hypothetical protein
VCCLKLSTRQHSKHPTLLIVFPDTVLLIVGINSLLSIVQAFLRLVFLLQKECIYRIMTRAAIQDDLSHPPGELGAQGSPRNKGRSFLKLGVPTPFHNDTIRKLPHGENGKRNIPVTGSQPFTLQGGLVNKYGLQEHIRTQ